MGGGVLPMIGNTASIGQSAGDWKTAVGSPLCEPTGTEGFCLANKFAKFWGKAGLRGRVPQGRLQRESKRAAASAHAASGRGSKRSISLEALAAAFI